MAIKDQVERLSHLAEAIREIRELKDSLQADGMNAISMAKSYIYEGDYESGIDMLRNAADSFQDALDLDSAVTNRLRVKTNKEKV